MPPTGRGRNGKYERSVDDAERMRKALRLRRDGHSYQEIADELGWASRSSSFTAIKKAIAEIPREAAEDLIQLEVERLTALIKKTVEIMRGEYVKVDHGRIVRDDDGNAILDPMPRLRAISELRRLSESLRELKGMDAPKRRIIEVPNGDDLEKLIALAEAEVAEAEAIENAQRSLS
jgi:hypothetical protein